MKILGIETSCDETAEAVVQDCGKLLPNVIVAQTSTIYSVWIGRKSYIMMLY